MILVQFVKMAIFLIIMIASDATKPVRNAIMILLKNIVLSVLMGFTSTNVIHMMNMDIANHVLKMVYAQNVIQHHNINAQIALRTTI